MAEELRQVPEETTSVPVAEQLGQNSGFMGDLYKKIQKADAQQGETTEGDGSPENQKK